MGGYGELENFLLCVSFLCACNSGAGEIRKRFGCGGKRGALAGVGGCGKVACSTWIEHAHTIGLKPGEGIALRCRRAFGD